MIMVEHVLLFIGYLMQVIYPRIPPSVQRALARDRLSQSRHEEERRKSNERRATLGSNESRFSNESSLASGRSSGSSSGRSDIRRRRTSDLSNRLNEPSVIDRRIGRAERRSRSLGRGRSRDAKARETTEGQEGSEKTRAEFDQAFGFDQENRVGVRTEPFHSLSRQVSEVSIVTNENEVVTDEEKGVVIQPGHVIQIGHLDR